MGGFLLPIRTFRTASVRISPFRRTIEALYGGDHRGYTDYPFATTHKRVA
jgi:hypothetical protein